MDPRRSYHLRSSRSLCPSCEVSVRWVKDTEHTASLAGWKDRNDLSFSDMLCTHRLSYRSLGALSLDLGVQSMEEASNIRSKLCWYDRGQKDWQIDAFWDYG